MIYSTTCSYAIRAMARLASIRPDGYVRIQEICEGTDLPTYFVAKIFRDLVREALLVSAKGRGGGVALAKPKNEIRLYDIVAAVDGAQQYQQCVVGLAKCDDLAQNLGFGEYRTRGSFAASALGRIGFFDDGEGSGYC